MTDVSVHDAIGFYSHLILPVVQLTVLYHTVTELKQVANGFIALVSQVVHFEEGFPPMSLQGDAQQVEDLQVRCGRGEV